MRTWFPWLGSLLLHGIVASFMLLSPQRDAQSTLSNIELIDRQLPQPEREPPPPTAVAVVAPQPDPTARIPARPRQRPAPPPDRPLAGQPEAQPSPAVDTGPKTFGITLSGATTVRSGQGVAVPQGATLAEDPGTQRVGQGRPDGARQGFGDSYAPGDEAPLAVVTEMPRVLKRIQAAYPEQLKERGVEGQVVLELTIDEAGKVIEARVLQNLHEILDDSARSAALAMTFSPARVGPTPVVTRIRYTFTFVLD